MVEEVLRLFTFVIAARLAKHIDLCLLVLLFNITSILGSFLQLFVLLFEFIVAFLEAAELFVFLFSKRLNHLLLLLE